jgi:arylsulfatase A-like enzyme
LRDSGIVGARIERTAKDSTPGTPVRIRAPKGAPNVVIVLLDDVGFATFGCYGSTIDTPNLDRLAANGLRYTQFQATPMCAPTRACLLTGRQSHAAGVGIVQESATAYPAYYGRLSKEASTLAEVLGPSGYNCFAVGKWHLAPISDWTAAGPFDYWPLQRGFERHYGFIAAGTDQWHPDLVDGNQSIERPARPGYHLTEDLIDKSISYIRDQTVADAEKPFFLYVALAACHSPLHVPKAFIEKYHGRFDKGWDEVRADWFARQLMLGIVPPGTRLAPRNPDVPAWNDLTKDEQRLFARYMELFAGYMDHTDHHLGRLMSYLEEIGRMENTIFVVLSDNGAADGGGRSGHVTSWGRIKGHDPIAEGLAAIDRLGDETTNPMYPTGWAQVGNTPFRFYKIDTYAGGTAVPFILHWPRGIKAKGEIRHQYHHVTDVFPTVLEAARLEAPTMYNGIPQLPVHGVSMSYSFDAAGAETQKESQYFENFGHRALWHNGWKVTTKHVPGTDFDDDHWALFDTTIDRSEYEDLSAKYPAKTREMIERWWIEAGKYGVLPLGEGDRNAIGDHQPTRQVYLQNMAPVSSRRMPTITLGSHSITTVVDVPAGGVSGVILAVGGRVGGFTMYARDSCLVYEYNLGSGAERTAIRADRPLSPGKRTVRFELRRSGSGGEGVLLIDGVIVGTGDIPNLHTMLIASQGINCGRDLGSPVSNDYEVPFTFTARFGPVVIERLA